MLMKFSVLIIGAYLLGSVPFGQIIARAHGKDLRTVGSGNIGATNLSRALGKKWAYLCFCLDVLKGFAPMLAASSLYSFQPGILQLLAALIVGCAAVLGHIFPIYMKFKGGKGVSTSFGVALGLWPYYTVCAAVTIVVWSAVVLLSRYVSLASITASVAFPVVLVIVITLTPAWDFADLWPLIIAAVAIPLMVIIRHRENITRLIEGTESKVLKASGKQHQCRRCQ